MQGGFCIKNIPVRYAVERMLWRCVFAAVAVTGVLVLVPQIWNLLSPFIIAILVAALLRKPIRFAQEKLKFKRGLAVAIGVMLVVLIFFALLYWFSSFAVVQIISASENAPSIVSGIVGFLQLATDKLLGLAKALPSSIGTSIEASLDGVFKTISDAGLSFAGNLVNYVVSFAASLPYAFVYVNFLILAMIFITNRYERIMGFLGRKQGSISAENFGVLRKSAGQGMMGYIRVQLLFSTLTLLISWVYFQSFGFEYAFLIGFFAAILEMIPQFGCGTLYIPWSVICFIVGDTRNGWVVLGLYLFYSLLRRITEPTLLGNNLGVSPLLSLIGMFVGMRMGGVIGLVLGPITMVILVSAVRSSLFDGILNDAKTIMRYMQKRWEMGREGNINEPR